ncbi:plastocyanin/azurin family copper-binding protein [Hyphomicrobium sp. 99]|uniref:plastocyanin/azurin family copper-binding protein n=1 Tax=Hyphomicrobium sp. 99 TaxID=1163419 RepID=UPI0005F7B458|nr:cupredoxin domain-containing protein [Hyphomicrobium sp. 99]
MPKIKLSVVLVGLLQFALTAPTSAGEIARVTINQLAFSPSDIEAKVGDTVEWINGDFIDHTATAKTGEWDVTIVAGHSAQLRLTRAGSFSYFCRVHPNMTGTINVVAN